MIETCDEPELHRTACGGEDDGNGLSCRHRGPGREVVVEGDDDRDIAADEISRHCRQLVDLTRRAIIDGDVSALDQAHFAQAAAESILRRQHIIKDADHRMVRPRRRDTHREVLLLRRSSDRPRCAAPPRSDMNSRRLIAPPRLQDRASYRIKQQRWKGPCPLWVKSRHVQRKRSCPLYPRKRTYTWPEPPVRQGDAAIRCGLLACAARAWFWPLAFSLWHAAVAFSLVEALAFLFEARASGAPRATHRLAVAWCRYIY